MNKRIVLQVSISYFSLVIGYSVWRLTIYSYAIGNFNFSTTDVAKLFSVASIPGVLIFLLGHINNRIDIYNPINVPLWVFCSGILWVALSPSPDYLWVGIFALSLGFYACLPYLNDLIIDESDHSKVYMALGRFKSLSPMALVLSTFIVLIKGDDSNISLLLILTCGFILISGTLSTRSIGHHQRSRKTLICEWSRTLWPYYLLNFISGARSALFRAYILTQFIIVYHFSSSQLSMIILLGACTSIIGYRLLGNVTRLIQPKSVLTGIYSLVFIIFLAFNYVGVMGFMILFLVDSLLFGSTVITDGYLKNHRVSENRIGDLVIGTSLFHTAGVIVPIMAAILWELYGQVAIYYLGMLFALIGMMVSWFALDNENESPEDVLINETLRKAL